MAKLTSCLILQSVLFIALTGGACGVGVGIWLLRLRAAKSDVMLDGRRCCAWGPPVPRSYTTSTNSNTS